MAQESSISFRVTPKERSLLLALLAARPPQGDESTQWTASGEIGDWDPEEYRAVWIAIDDKLRSAEGTSVGDLLARSRSILVELRELGVIRTDNAPAGDYAEWLVSQATDAPLETSSSESFDLRLEPTDEFPEGERVQVKARTVSEPPKRGQRQLSVFRSWDFDSLVAVLFDETFRVRKAGRVPVEVVRDEAAEVEHVNGWRVFATDEFLLRGEDWTECLNAVAGQAA
jgi:hypothetical protein